MQNYHAFLMSSFNIKWMNICAKNTIYTVLIYMYAKLENKTGPFFFNAPSLYSHRQYPEPASV